MNNRRVIIFLSSIYEVSFARVVLSLGLFRLRLCKTIYGEILALVAMFIIAMVINSFLITASEQENEL